MTIMFKLTDNRKKCGYQIRTIEEKEENISLLMKGNEETRKELLENYLPSRERRRIQEIKVIDKTSKIIMYYEGKEIIREIEKMLITNFYINNYIYKYIYMEELINVAHDFEENKWNYGCKNIPVGGIFYGSIIDLKNKIKNEIKAYKEAIR